MSDVVRKVTPETKAKIAQVDYEERIGQLVPVAQVKKDTFALARITRDALLAIPDRLASELSGITDQFEIHAKLTAEIKQALAEISRVAKV